VRKIREMLVHYEDERVFERERKNVRCGEEYRRKRRRGNCEYRDKQRSGEFAEQIDSSHHRVHVYIRRHSEDVQFKSIP